MQRAKFEYHLNLAAAWLRRAILMFSISSGDNNDEDPLEDTFYRNEGDPPSRSEKEFQRYRYGFYRLFAEITKKGESKSYRAPETIDEREDFGRFLDRIKFNAQISYGPITLLLHLYLLYTYTTRTIFCPSSKYLSFNPNAECPAHTVTFLDHVYAILLAFYTATFIAHFVYPALERVLLLYGTEQGGKGKGQRDLMAELGRGRRCGCLLFIGGFFSLPAGGYWD
ncbi:hypothetical protein SpCBS45565_g03678 [Spizellomyces sp. 'palustris']|nr:hypothetical protein SpCBS45565_g03678 [Spizellomyces sp. 'palustris']